MLDINTEHSNRRPLARLVSASVIGTLAAVSLSAATTAYSVQPGNTQDPASSRAFVRQSVDTCVQTAMDAYDIPGLAVAVVVEGEIAYERGYGVKHRSQGGAVDEHTAFRFGSVGKMFTAAAILRLVDQGVIDLDDPVTEFVPELHFAPGRWSADQMRVRHLVNNTAAIPSFREMPHGTLSQWALTLDEIPLLAKPGTFFNYSNSNFALAALVVERASGMAFNDYSETEIYRPAGMTATTRYPAEARASGNYSYGHSDDGSIYAPDDYTSSIDGFTSVHDLARWAQIMMQGGADVLSNRSRTMVQSPQAPLHFYGGHPRSIGGGAYGFGLFVDDYPGGRIVWHDGGIPGWVSHLGWLPRERFAVALLVNSWPAAFDGMRQATECIYDTVSAFIMPDMSEPGDPSNWSRFVGTYDAVFEDGYEFEIEIVFDNGDLMMTAPHPNNPDQLITRTLDPVHGNSFLYWVNEESWWDITLIATNGKPGHFCWLRNPRFVGFKRIDPLHATRRMHP